MRPFRAVLIAAALMSTAAIAEVPKPAALTADGIPGIPDELATSSRPYMEFRTAGFAGWNAADRSMLVSTRFGNTAQLHTVATPLGMRRQISFEVEPVGGYWSPKGDTLVVSKDVGGGEFFQLYTLASGRLALLTDGKSRNEFGSWDQEGRLIGYSSTRRNGTDSDLYVVDPRDPKKQPPGRSRSRAAAGGCDRISPTRHWPLFFVASGMALIPTSMTTTPGLIQSPRTIWVLPIAAIRMSACRTTPGKSFVREWQTVTVAFFPIKQQSHRHTLRVRASEHHRVRALRSSHPIFRVGKYNHRACKAQRAGSRPFCARRAMSSGEKPSTSFSILIRERTRSSSICDGMGSCTRMPFTVGSAFRRLTKDFHLFLCRVRRQVFTN